MSEPLVSVLVPARDAERFLAEALESALAQPLALELLVCDDGSRDGTRAVARRLGARVLCHDRPCGVVAARNALLAAARGRYVAFLDADDVYLPGGLAAQVALLERRADVVLVHGGAEIIDEDGRELPPWRRPFSDDAVEDGPAAFAELLLSNELVTSTVVARRSALLAAGGFHRVGPSSSDWDLWLRLTRHGAVAYRAAPVARYRQHPASISAATTATGARLRCDARVIHRALSLCASHGCTDGRCSRRARSALAARALLVAGDLHVRGERRSALRALLLAARMRPDLLRAGLAALARAIVARDDYAAFTASNALLDRLAGALVGTRYGGLIAARAAKDPDWEATLRRIASTVQAVTPPDAVLGTVTKWDPTLLRLSGRRGRNFPTGSYPSDGAAAVAQLEQQRAAGLSHLVVPSASFWWLDHYAGLAERLRAPRHADADCLIFDLDAAA
ncbi:MAG TPA: glycosyltransferase [Conexibacter sp.]